MSNLVTLASISVDGKDVLTFYCMDGQSSNEIFTTTTSQNMSSLNALPVSYEQQVPRTIPISYKQSSMEAQSISYTQPSLHGLPLSYGQQAPCILPAYTLPGPAELPSPAVRIPAASDSPAHKPTASSKPTARVRPIQKRPSGKIRGTEGPYKCPKCPRSYELQQHLDIHSSVHKDFKGKFAYGCPDCARRFRHKGHLALHQRKHTPSTPGDRARSDRKSSAVVDPQSPSTAPPLTSSDDTEAWTNAATSLLPMDDNYMNEFDASAIFEITDKDIEELKNILDFSSF